MAVRPHVDRMFMRPVPSLVLLLLGPELQKQCKWRSSPARGTTHHQVRGDGNRARESERWSSESPRLTKTGVAAMYSRRCSISRFRLACRDLTFPHTAVQLWTHRRPRVRSPPTRDRSRVSRMSRPVPAGPDPSRGVSKAHAHVHAYLHTERRTSSGPAGLGEHLEHLECGW